MKIICSQTHDKNHFSEFYLNQNYNLNYESVVAQMHDKNHFSEFYLNQNYESVPKRKPTRNTYLSPKHTPTSTLVVLRSTKHTPI